MDSTSLLVAREATTKTHDGDNIDHAAATHEGREGHGSGGRGGRSWQQWYFGEKQKSGEEEGALDLGLGLSDEIANDVVLPAV